MSYDIYLQIDTGAPELVSVIEVGNYTRNVSPMWTEAMGTPMASLDLELARDVEPIARRGVAAMLADPDKYEAVNPPNGWGDANGAREYLQRLADLCAEHPKTVLLVRG